MVAAIGCDERPSCHGCRTISRAPETSINGFSIRFPAKFVSNLSIALKSLTQDLADSNSLVSSALRASNALFSPTVASHSFWNISILRLISSLWFSNSLLRFIRSSKCCCFLILDRLADSRFEIILFLFFSSTAPHGEFSFNPALPYCADDIFSMFQNLRSIKTPRLEFTEARNEMKRNKSQYWKRVEPVKKHHREGLEEKKPTQEDCVVHITVLQTWIHDQKLRNQSKTPKAETENKKQKQKKGRTETKLMIELGETRREVGKFWEFWNMLFIEDKAFQISNSLVDTLKSWIFQGNFLVSGLTK